MNPRMVYTLLGFIASPLHESTMDAMNPGRVYTPLGFIASPLD